MALSATPRTLSPSGLTANQTAELFIRVGLTGVQPLLDTMGNIMSNIEKGDALRKIAIKAAKPIEQSYKTKALHHDCTGNLAASTKIKSKKYAATGIGIAVVGPEQTGREGATGSRPSGNHAWLVEFGSGPRTPGSQNRKTYVNVHEMVNRKMRLTSRLEDSEDFAKRSAGYYFLMSSWYEPTRQARAGRGYPHDFMPIAGGRRRVFTLHPGETYGAMPAFSLMQNSISDSSAKVSGILRTGIIDAINAAVSRGI
jgi:hypothetical protein